ncbi:MAG: hypothetical protein AB8B88_00485 [Devosiaceae bacterium]
MKRLTLMAALACLVAMPALAQKGPRPAPEADPVLGVTLDEFSDTGPNSLDFMGAQARIEARANNDTTTTPIFIIETNGAEVLRFEGEPSFYSFLPVSLRIANIDGASDLPEVIATSYTGGAHCCERVQIAAQQPDGSWAVHELGLFDGGYGLVDADEDGFAEIEVADQSFLYTFDCYACSAPPPRFYEIVEGAPIDASGNPDLYTYFEAELARLEDPATMLDQPGRLAGWAGLVARLGRGEAAISQLTQLNAAPDAFYEGCVGGGSMWECADENKVQMDFIAFLRNHLIDHGYIDEGRSTQPGGKG